MESGSAICEEVSLKSIKAVATWQKQAEASQTHLGQPSSSYKWTLSVRSLLKPWEGQNMSKALPKQLGLSEAFHEAWAWGSNRFASACHILSMGQLFWSSSILLLHCVESFDSRIGWFGLGLAFWAIIAGNCIHFCYCAASTNSGGCVYHWWCGSRRFAGRTAVCREQNIFFCWGGEF